MIGPGLSLQLPKGSRLERGETLKHNFRAEFLIKKTNASYRYSDGSFHLVVVGDEIITSHAVPAIHVSFITKSQPERPSSLIISAFFFSFSIFNSTMTTSTSKRTAHPSDVADHVSLSRRLRIMKRRLLLQHLENKKKTPSKNDGDANHSKSKHASALPGGSSRETHSTPAHHVPRRDTSKHHQPRANK